VIDAVGLSPGSQLVRSPGLSQLIKNVRDVPAAVDDPDNLDDAGTLAVEDQIVTVRQQS
jgi:hypothetical protein